MAMVTGQLPSKIGSYDNACSIGSDTPTYAHYLRAAGYETTLAGKMHFIASIRRIPPYTYEWMTFWPDITNTL